MDDLFTEDISWNYSIILQIVQNVFYGGYKLERVFSDNRIVIRRIVILSRTRSRQ